MKQQPKLERILFLDVETIPLFEDYRKAPQKYKYLWDKKASHLIKEEETPEDIYQRAGIYAEFGKIICISVARYAEEQIHVRSFFGHDEKQLLESFCSFLNKRYKDPDQDYLCAHNGKEFDYPYIARRILINNLKLPVILNISGRKPWEIRHLDTMEMWKFGDWKAYTSLELMAYIFGIKTPKDDIDGSMIFDVYYKDQDLSRIVEYCQKDTITVLQVYLRLTSNDIISEDRIKIFN